MILLENINTITYDLILTFLNDADKKPLSTQCSDFDGCELFVWSEGNFVSVALRSGAAKSLLANGGQEALAQAYGSSLTTPVQGYDVTIRADTTSISATERESFATKFSQLKPHLYSAPILRVVQAATSGKTLPGVTDIPIRSQNERVWIKQDDTERITVIFSVDFAVCQIAWIQSRRRIN